MSDINFEPGDAYMYNGHSFRGHMFIYVDDIESDPIFFDSIDGKCYRVANNTIERLVTANVPHPKHDTLPKFDFIKNIDPKVFEWVKANTKLYINKKGPLKPVSLD